MDIGSFDRDAESIEAGAWVDNIDGAGDLRLKVRGLSSNYVAAIRSRKERSVGLHEREQNGSLKPDVALRIFREILVEAVLLGWDNITDNDKPVKYSKDLAVKWVFNPERKMFSDVVTVAAQMLDNKTAAKTGEAAKN